MYKVSLYVKIDSVSETRTNEYNALNTANFLLFTL